jgi:vanillate O-demethylase ferredoxin subunit
MARERLSHPLMFCVYICGPSGFMDYVINGALKIGVSREQLHTEYFAGVQSVEGPGDTSFVVKVASTGACIVVQANETIVGALNRHGIEIPVSCEQGICGTCLTRVIDGKVAHRDAILSDSEKAKNDVMTPCCSRAQGDSITLDI